MAKAERESRLKQAFIQVLDARGKMKEEISVLFFPPEYTMEKRNEFANVNIPGLESPLLQFVRGGLETLRLDLFFDTYAYKNSEDVRNYTNKVVDLLKIDPELHAPPILNFVWGKNNFLCVLSQVSKKFTMFRPDGVPVRATLTVTLTEYRTEANDRERSLESPDRTKHYVVKDGDSLWILAAQVYGDPGQWRVIARANQIENPRFLAIGQELTIPPLE